MAARQQVTPTVPLPRFVEVPADLGLTPNEMRAYRELTGQPISSLDEDAGAQAMVWIMLRRAGHDATLAEAGDVELRRRSAPTVADPTVTASSPSSRLSVTGGA